MRREEYENEVLSWGDIFDLCNEIGEYEPVAGIMCYDDMAAAVEERIPSCLRYNSWTDLRSDLEEIYSDGEYYRQGDGDLEFYCVDDDDYEFGEAKETLLRILNENNYFEEDEVADEPEETANDLWYSEAPEDLSQILALA